MKTLKLFLNGDQLFEAEEDEGNSEFRISFPSDIPIDTLHGIYCGIMDRSVDAAEGCVELEDFTCSDYWFFDVPQPEMFELLPNKTRYLVFFPHMEDYGVFVAVENIEDFFSGLTSFSESVDSALHLKPDRWDEVRYLDLTERDYTQNEIEESLDRFGKAGNVTKATKFIRLDVSITF